VTVVHVARVVPRLVVVVVHQARLELVAPAEKVLRVKAITRVHHPAILRPKAVFAVAGATRQTVFTIQVRLNVLEAVFRLLTLGAVVGPPTHITRNDVEQRRGADGGLVLTSVDGGGVCVVACVLERAELTSTILPD